VVALADRGDKESLGALASSLGDSDKEVRVAAAQAIGKVSSGLIQRGDSEAPKAAVEKVSRLLQSSDERERIAASGALLNMGDRSQATAMRGGTQSADASVRRQALEDGDADDELLTKSLSDSSAKVRFAAARKLAHKGNKQSISVLREVAASSELDAVAAYGLLTKLGEEVEPPPKSVMLGASVAERHALLGTIATLPAKAARKLLPGLASDPSAVVRRRAAEVAHKLYQTSKDSAFLPTLRALRNDSDVLVRSRASQLLSELAKQNPQVLTVKPPVESPAEAKVKPQPTPKEPTQPEVKNPVEPTSSTVQAGSGFVQFVGEEGLRVQIDKGAPQPLPDKPIPLAAGKHRISSVAGAQDVQVGAGVTVTVKVSGTLTEQLVHDASDALRSKDLARAQILIERARRIGLRTGARPQLLAELLFLQAKLYDGRGQWREAMNEYGKYLSLPAAHQRADTAAAVRSAVAKLAPRMGRVQIFTLRDGKCKLTEEYYLPPGEHLISLGGGKSKVMSMYAGVTTPVRQCP
jgi:HEAT repeat protein